MLLGRPYPRFFSMGGGKKEFFRGRGYKSTSKHIKHYVFNCYVLRVGHEFQEGVKTPSPLDKTMTIV